MSDSVTPPIKLEPVTAVKAKDTTKDMKASFGVPGELLISTYHNEEVRVDDLKLSDYRRMKDNDGQVQMLINATVNTILSAGITIKDDIDFQTDNKSKKEKVESEEKKFVEENLLRPYWKGGMSKSFEEVCRDFLRALEEGYRPQEVIYRIGDDGRLRIDRVAPRAAKTDNERSLQIIVDKNGHYVGFHQKTSFASQTVDVIVVNDSEFAKTINVVYGEEYGSNYGRSALRAPWYHYDKAHKAMYLNHIGHELGAVKFRHLKKLGGGTPEQDAALETALERVGMISWMSYPSQNYELLFEDVADAAVMQVGKEMIDYHTGQMAKAWLAQFVDLGTTNSGNRALGESQTDFFKVGLQAVARTLIEKPWNKLIADLVKINFNSDIYPSLVVNPINDQTSENLFGLFSEMVKKGNINPVIVREIEKSVSDNLGMEISEEELEAGEEEKKEAEQAEMNMKQQQFDQQMQMKQQSMKAGKSVNNSEEEHDHIHLEEPIQRALYPDEEKVKFADIFRKMNDVEARGESLLKHKLNNHKEEIINQYLSAAREGRKAIRKVKIELAESKYSEELYLLAAEMLEFGKVMAANELEKPVPNTTENDRTDLQEEIDMIIESQIAAYRFRLMNVANDSLKKNRPENETRLMMEQEHNQFWTAKLLPTLGVLIPKSYNTGRAITFRKYSDDIFAFRYTAKMENTCKYCERLDGRVFQESDPNYAFLEPPQHFRCKCQWTPISKIEAKEYGTRVDGKPNQLPVYSSLSTFQDVDITNLSDKEFETRVLQLVENDK